MVIILIYVTKYFLGTFILKFHFKLWCKGFSMFGPFPRTNPDCTIEF